jgi:uncharacterized protein (DUF3084 family)
MPILILFLLLCLPAFSQSEIEGVETPNVSIDKSQLESEILVLEAEKAQLAAEKAPIVTEKSTLEAGLSSDLDALWLADLKAKADEIKDKNDAIKAKEDAIKAADEAIKYKQALISASEADVEAP